jgi:hypothetical protein
MTETVETPIQEVQQIEVIIADIEKHPERLDEDPQLKSAYETAKSEVVRLKGGIGQESTTGDSKAIDSIISEKYGYTNSEEFFSDFENLRTKADLAEQYDRELEMMPAPLFDAIAK